MGNSRTGAGPVSGRPNPPGPTLRAAPAPRPHAWARLFPQVLPPSSGGSRLHTSARQPGEGIPSRGSPAWLGPGSQTRSLPRGGGDTGRAGLGLPWARGHPSPCALEGSPRSPAELSGKNSCLTSTPASSRAATPQFGLILPLLRPSSPYKVWIVLIMGKMGHGPCGTISRSCTEHLRMKI